MTLDRRGSTVAAASAMNAPIETPAIATFGVSARGRIDQWGSAARLAENAKEHAVAIGERVGHVADDSGGRDAVMRRVRGVTVKPALASHRASRPASRTPSGDRERAIPRRAVHRIRVKARRRALECPYACRFQLSPRHRGPEHLARDRLPPSRRAPCP